MYRPKENINELSLRFQAQAASRRAPWTGRKAGLHICGARKDKQIIEKIIAYAEEHSPTARQALAWARAHDLTVMAQQKKGTLLGRYQGGVVLLCLPRLQAGGFIDYQTCVETLVHEIRHAWQDYYGLLSVSPVKYMGATYTRTSDALIANAFYEADAYAMGELAGKECRRPKGVSNPAAALRFEFMRWFRHYADIYSRDQTAYLRRVKNPLVRMIAGCFNRSAHTLPYTAVDWPLYISRLGRTFDGFHYLASMNDYQRDDILRILLSPSEVIGPFDAKARTGAYKLELRDRQRRLDHIKANPCRTPRPA